MRRVIWMESAVRGVLTVNGQFCGPMDGEGQAFPAGGDAEIYIQLFPVGEGLPLTAQMRLSGGQIETLEPKESCFALVWPDGVIQLELRPQTARAGDAPAPAERAAAQTLLRYLTLRLTGDAQAAALWMRPQDERGAPDLSAYHAAVPMRFAPAAAGGRFDERAGLVRRTAENVAQVDTALAVTSPAGQGRRLIERMEILRA